MNRKEQQQEIEKFFDRCKEILQKKAHDYAQDEDCFSNFRKTALMCEVPVEKIFLMFMSVKIARLIELTKKKNLIEETKQDTLIDIANYACLMYLYITKLTT